MRQAVFAAILVLACAHPSLAQTRPVTTDDVMAMKSVGSPVVSPDGASVLYTVRAWEEGDEAGRFEARTHVWRVAAAGGPARQVTFGSRGESQPAWSPDGRYMSFVAARGDGQGEDAPRPQVYGMRRDGGEAVALTDAEEGVRAYAWSPDSGQIAYVTADPRPDDVEARLKRREDATPYEADFRYSHLWTVAVASGKAARLTEGTEMTVEGAPSWSPDGRRLAFAAAPTPMTRDDRSDVYIVDVGTRAVKPITTNRGPDQAPRWSPDGRTIAYVSEPNTNAPLGDGIAMQNVGLSHLVLYDVATGTATDTARTDFDVSAGTPGWSADSARIYFTAGRGVYSEVFAYDVAASTFRQLTKETVVSLGTASHDGAVMAFVMQGPADAPDVYVAGPELDDIRRVTTANPQAAEFALGSTEVVRWTSGDGLAIEGILLHPVGVAAGTPAPLVVVAHGGPTGAHTNGYRVGGLEAGQVLAGKGWAVFYPNVRGSSNYGESFMRANIPDWGGGDWQDLMTGVDALVARGVADPQKLALIGWSYGGYMTAWGITQTDRFKAAMVGAGITNVWSMYGTNDIPNYLGTFFKGIPSASTLELYMQRSAMRHVDKVTTPTLILHGAADDRVPTGQALELHRALKERGKIVELVFYPREGHSFREYYHLKDRMDRIHAWLDRFVLNGGKKTTTQ